MEYLMSPCIFCSIIEKKSPSTTIYEDDYTLVIKDIAPKAPIHYLIIPKKHVADINTLTPDDQLMTGHLLLVAKKISEQESLPDFRLVVNNGRGAGQIVFHLHIHFLSGTGLSHL